MEKQKNKADNVKLYLLLVIPFLLFCIGISLLSVFFFREYVESSEIWRFIVNSGAVNTPDGNEKDEVLSDGEVIEGSMADVSIDPIKKPNNSEDGEETSKDNIQTEQIYYDKKDFPGYKWGALWGKLSVPSIGLENKNMYVGESNAIYKKGIGKRYGTRFPGQGGNIVLGAHVTKECYHLQDLKIGDKVYIETGYGSYVYEVYETFIFSIDDAEHVMNYDDGEKLTMYTCHPRGTAYRTERYCVLCKKISGPEWIKIDW